MEESVSEIVAWTFVFIAFGALAFVKFIDWYDPLDWEE